MPCGNEAHIIVLRYPEFLFIPGSRTFFVMMIHLFSSLNIRPHSRMFIASHQEWTIDRIGGGYCQAQVQAVRCKTSDLSIPIPWMRSVISVSCSKILCQLNILICLMSNLNMMLTVDIDWPVPADMMRWGYSWILLSCLIIKLTDCKANLKVAIKFQTVRPINSRSG